MSDPPTSPDPPSVDPSVGSAGAVAPNVPGDDNSTDIAPPQAGEPAAARHGGGQAASSSDLASGASSWPSRDIVDEWGLQSFPASDPPANW
jgi:hypothetical protein